MRTTLLLGVMIMATQAGADWHANYDESQVGEYTLPDPLVMLDGSPVTDADTWRAKRRGEVLSLFQTHMYGKSPGPHPGTLIRELSAPAAIADGLGTRREARVLFTGREEDGYMDILLYLPARAQGPVPVFASLNFMGNHAIRDDPAITLCTSWLPDRYPGVVDNRATEASRGTGASRWAVERILERGYGLATAYYGDLDPDFDDGFQNGIHPLFYREGQTRPDPDQWGSIGASAWGLSRILDYLETCPEVDASRIAIMGHSRLGKASLWAGAQDERFALVISNNSGCGGASLSRRNYGETVWRINTVFPHWFCLNFRRYNDNEAALPVDQHMLIALMAPRPVYIASAVEDKWADPKGEFLSGVHATPVYELFGHKGLYGDQPPVDQPVMNRIGYHVRSGGHDVLPYDWERYMDFADMHLRK